MKQPKELQAELLKNHFVPVNEVFYNTYLSRDFDILLLFGGFGSGKSVVASDMLIDACLIDPYFKCFYGRKIFDTVRWSIFDTIVDRIEERGLKNHFDYSRKPNSSMVIACRDNTNIFLPFGADNPGKLQSLKDASHFLCEEFDQFTQDDFKIFFSRLRTLKARTQLIALFNSTFVTHNHWVWKLFFTEHEVVQDDIKVSDYKVEKVFCNYPNNAFIDQVEYEKKLWLSAGYDEKVFREIAGGEWGSEDTRNKFAYAFSSKLHVINVAKESGSQFMQIDPDLPLHLTFDFNVDPMTCLVAQKGPGIKWCKVIDEYRLRNSDIYDLCERILSDYGDYFFVATGDASGRARIAATRGKRSYIIILKDELGLSINQCQFPTHNPSVSDTRVLMNAIFKKHGNFWISSKCQYLIDDLLSVEVDETGEIDKKTDKLKTHLLDNLRYLQWNYFRSFLNKKK